MTDATLHIGLDDTDSPRMGCTTYVASLLVEKLQGLGARFLDYPNLVRLNPNVRWKTRGNGALCLRVRLDRNVTDRLVETTIDTVEQNSDIESRRTDPGIVFLQCQTVPEDIRRFASEAVTDVVALDSALRLMKKHGAWGLGLKNGRGIIGALAAVGNLLAEDHTFEILAYRKPENFGTKRKIDEESIFEMSQRSKPLTFNNVDEEKRRVIITPRGPDPILFGIRGETAEIVKQAFTMVASDETVDRWMIVRSNQGTDAHLRRFPLLDQIRPYSSVIVHGAVSSSPRVIRGRHVFFSIRDASKEVDCAAFEPTGNLRKIARELIVGDDIEAYGAVKARSSSHKVTINLEKIRILSLAPKLAPLNPVCSRCGKRLKSMGKGQGFRCEKCGVKYGNHAKIEVTMPRQLKTGLYVTSPRSQRHLTKPLVRYGQEKTRSESRDLVDGWHFP